MTRSTEGGVNSCESSPVTGPRSLRPAGSCSTVSRFFISLDYTFAGRQALSPEGAPAETGRAARPSRHTLAIAEGRLACHLVPDCIFCRRRHVSCGFAAGSRGRSTQTFVSGPSEGSENRRVQTAADNHVVGRFVSATSHEITLSVSGRRVQMPTSSVVRVERRVKDSVWNGVGIGAPPRRAWATPDTIRPAVRYRPSSPCGPRACDPVLACGSCGWTQGPSLTPLTPR